LKAGSASEVYAASRRNFDVESFIGNPKQAKEQLGWKSKISLADGVNQLIHKFIKGDSLSRRDF
jgi:GDP-D-mannose dehydratase